MKIQCHAELPLEGDEPIAAIRQFVRILREHAVETGKAEIDLNLIGSSARARTTIQEFQPGRTKVVPFKRALEVTEELTCLGTAKIKSLHFMLVAEGIRWRGSNEGASGRLALLDGKSFHRKKRFSLLALLTFEAANANEPFIEKMFGETAKATGIPFRLQASQMQVGPNDPGRATEEELFVTSLTWMELIERVGEKVRKQITLAGVPHLMTKSEALQFLFDPSMFGKSVRVDFTRIVRKWLKEEFPEYKRIPETLDDELLQKEIAEGVVATLSVEKRPKAFSKEFTIGLGVGLTSPRFAPAPDRPFELTVNLFRLFGIAPLPMQWTYRTEADLAEALKGAATLVKRVQAIFEAEAAQMRNAHERTVEEFEGPREVSAKEAYELAIPLALSWAEDAGLIRMSSGQTTARFQAPLSTQLPAMGGKGRLTMSGGWWLQFHSRRKHENLYVTVPCWGRIAHTRLDAPEGRHWPSDADQILRDGWMDSVEALELARAVAQEKGVAKALAETQQFELSSRANPAAKEVPRPPFRDGMFVMEAAWRISFSLSSEKDRKVGSVTIPAYGGGAPKIEVHVFDKLGRPIQP